MESTTLADFTVALPATNHMRTSRFQVVNNTIFEPFTSFMPRTRKDSESQPLLIQLPASDDSDHEPAPWRTPSAFPGLPIGCACDKQHTGRLAGPRLTVHGPFVTVVDP